VEVEVVAGVVVVVATLAETAPVVAAVVAELSSPQADRASNAAQPTAIDLRRMRQSAIGSALQHGGRR
jgi:hypothetical protein